jgi:hypothetical protein
MFAADIEWYKFEGASDSEIANLESSTNYELPALYIKLLRFSNGGECSLKVQPFTFVLDSVSDVVCYLQSDSSLFYKDYFIFGGNGAGELLAIQKSTGAIVSIDACNSNLEEIVLVAQSFSDLISLVG